MLPCNSKAFFREFARFKNFGRSLEPSTMSLRLVCCYVVAVCGSSGTVVRACSITSWTLVVVCEVQAFVFPGTGTESQPAKMFFLGHLAHPRILYVRPSMQISSSFRSRSAMHLSKKPLDELVTRAIIASATNMLSVIT